MQMHKPDHLVYDKKYGLKIRILKMNLGSRFQPSPPKNFPPICSDFQLPSDH